MPSYKTGLQPGSFPYKLIIKEDLETLPGRFNFGNAVVAEYQGKIWKRNDLFRSSKRIQKLLSEYKESIDSGQSGQVFELHKYLIERDLLIEVAGVVLRSEGHLQSQKGPIKVYFKVPAYKVVGPGVYPILLGDPDAKETVEFFGNFQCASCLKSLNYLANRMNNEKSFNIRFRFAQSDKFLVRFILVEAALCAKEQGLQKFFNFYYRLAGETKPFSEAEMVNFARIEGINVDQMNQCRFAGVFKEVARYHNDYSSYLGIEEIPVFFVRGQIFKGNVDPRQVEKIFPVPSKAGILGRLKSLFFGLFTRPKS